MRHITLMIAYDIADKNGQCMFKSEQIFVRKQHKWSSNYRKKHSLKKNNKTVYCHMASENTKYCTHVILRLQYVCHLA